MIYKGKIRRLDLDEKVFDIRNKDGNVTIKYDPYFRHDIMELFCSCADVEIEVDKDKNLIFFYD